MRWLHDLPHSVAACLEAAGARACDPDRRICTNEVDPVDQTEVRDIPDDKCLALPLAREGLYQCADRSNLVDHWKNGEVHWSPTRGALVQAWTMRNLFNVPLDGRACELPAQTPPPVPRTEAAALLTLALERTEEIFLEPLLRALQVQPREEGRTELYELTRGFLAARWVAQKVAERNGMDVGAAVPDAVPWALAYLGDRIDADQRERLVTYLNDARQQRSMMSTDKGIHRFRAAPLFFPRSAWAAAMLPEFWRLVSNWHHWVRRQYAPAGPPPPLPVGQ